MTERPRRDVDDRLADWVDGRLSDKERERFVAELRVNAQLREDLERYERTVGVVRAALRAPAPAVDLADRVMAAIAAAPSAAPRRWTLQGVGWGLAAAAALLATAVWIDSWTPASPSSQDTAAVDRLRDQAAPPAGGTWDGERAARQPDAGDAALPKPALERLQAVEEANEAAGAPSPRAPAAPAPLEAAVPEPPPPEAAPAPANARERADDMGKGAPPTKVAPQPEGSVAPGNPTNRFAPVPGGIAGPATGGPGAAPAPGAGPTQEDLRKAAGARAAEMESADAPVPLLIVDGLAIVRASDNEKLEAAKDRTSRGSAPAAGGGGSKSGDAKAGEPKPGEPKVGTGEAGRSDSFLGARAGLDDAALQARIDAFLADAATAATPPAAIGWTTARGELRLSPMVEGTADAAPRSTGRGSAEPPIVRSWLVEGARADVEVLLARLARFTKEHQLTVRAEETRPPVEKRESDEREKQAVRTESAAAPAKPEVARMVLRFRLRPR